MATKRKRDASDAAKKPSTKSATKVQESEKKNAGVGREEKKPAEVNEIDAIFAVKKIKKSADATTTTTTTTNDTTNKHMATKATDKKLKGTKMSSMSAVPDTSKDALFSDPRGKNAGGARTDDGLKIIPVEQLNIGKGGGKHFIDDLVLIVW